MTGPYSIAEISQALGATAYGQMDLRVRGAAEPATAGPSDLALAMSPGFAKGLSAGRARAAIVWPGADWQALGLLAAIEAPRARLALATLTGMLDAERAFSPGRHEMSWVHLEAEVADDVWIGPFTEIGAGARVAPGTRIAGRVTVGAGVDVGADVRIHAGVTLQPGVRIGARAVIQPGAVIGADGFSFVTETESHPETVKRTRGAQRLTPPDGDARWHKIASLGGVEIGDDVEIGANSTIDAGTIRATVIGNRTKLDNLVHVGHNCLIGEDNLICGQAGIAGSVVMGDRVVLAGQVGVGDHQVIGSDVVIGAGAGVLSNVPSGRVMLGYPAAPMPVTLAGYKALRRLARKPVSKPRDKA